MNPVKGAYCLEPRRLRSCSDTMSANAHRGLLLADLECSVRSMAYRFTSPPPPVCVSTWGDFLEAETCRCRSRYVRPTFATYQPVDLYPRSWLPSYLELGG